MDTWISVLLGYCYEQMYVQISVCVFAFFFIRYVLRIGIYFFHFFKFWGITILFYMPAVPFYIPISSVQGLQFLHTFTNTCYFLFFFIAS